MKGKVGDFILIVDDLHIKKYEGCLGKIIKIIWDKYNPPFQYLAKIYNSPVRNQDYFYDEEIIILKSKTFKDAKDEVMVELL